MMEATNGLGKGVIFGLVSTARDFVAELMEKRSQVEQEVSEQKDNIPTETEVGAHLILLFIT